MINRGLISHRLCLFHVLSNVFCNHFASLAGYIGRLRIPLHRNEWQDMQPPNSIASDIEVNELDLHD